MRFGMGSLAGWRGLPRCGSSLGHTPRLEGLSGGVRPLSTLIRTPSASRAATSKT
jgi:hypothetical protein